MLVNMFVTFEGPEGAGKTSVIRELAAHLEMLSRPFVVTREPGDGDVGRAIRQILLDGLHVSPKAELLLFLADRAQHVQEMLLPALKEGKVILCDRYSDSTLVYQGYGRGYDLGELRRFNSFATGDLAPDVTFLLDLDPAIGLARQTDRDRLDKEPLEFHQKIRDGFLMEAGKDPSRWHVIDASLPIAEVVENVWAILQRKLVDTQRGAR